mgnify:CR=1 FL=1
MLQITEVNLISKKLSKCNIYFNIQCVDIDTDNIIAVSMRRMNERHENVIKECKAPQRITWHILWSQPPQTVSRLNNHVTVHIQPKVIIWSWGKNTRVVLDHGLSPLSHRSPNPRLILTCWWTLSMYVEPFLLFITKRNKFKEL